MEQRYDGGYGVAGSVLVRTRGLVWIEGSVLMSVTEAQRHHLYESLKSHLGAEEAETFMNLMPPANWSEFAMKSDIAELRAELKGDMAVMRDELKGEMAELRVELKGDMAVMRDDIVKTLGTWLFASQAAVITAIGVIAGITIAFLN